MTNQEIKTKEALSFMGYKELREISQSELDLSFKALSHKMNPETTTLEKYKDGKDYLLLLEYYNYLSDIKRTNETIRNILDPENKTYDYQEEKPEIKEEINDTNNQSFENSNTNTANNYNEFGNPAFSQIKIADKPSIFSIILSLLFPIYGVLMFVFSRRITPKASKWYLIFGIIGFAINVAITIYLMYSDLGLMVGTDL